MKQPQAKRAGQKPSRRRLCPMDRIRRAQERHWPTRGKVVYYLLICLKREDDTERRSILDTGEDYSWHQAVQAITNRLINSPL
jgi:hypothetical protein